MVMMTVLFFGLFQHIQTVRKSSFITLKLWGIVLPPGFVRSGRLEFITVKVNGTCCLQGCSLFWVTPFLLRSILVLH